MVGVCDHASFFKSFSSAAVHSIIIVDNFYSLQDMSSKKLQAFLDMIMFNYVLLLFNSVTGLSIDGKLDK